MNAAFVHLTVEELRGLGQAFGQLLEPYRGRTAESHQGTQPVSVWTQAFPVRPPRKEGDAE